MISVAHGRAPHPQRQPTQGSGLTDARLRVELARLRDSDNDTARAIAIVGTLLLRRLDEEAAA